MPDRTLADWIGFILVCGSIVISAVWAVGIWIWLVCQIVAHYSGK